MMADNLFPVITLAAVVISAIAAVIAAVYSWVGSRQTHEVHLSLNSRLDAFIAAAETTARRQGADDALAEDRISRAAAQTTDRFRSD